MLEFVTEAVVLDKIDLGEQDSKVFLFTKLFGKITAKIKSSKKITSKLSPHSEPLNFVTVRIVDKKYPQLIDALSSGKILPSKTVFKTLSLIKELSPENQPDENVWAFLESLKGGKIGEDIFIQALKILGFDPVHAKCANCVSGRPDFFSIKDLTFYCKKCNRLHI